MRRLFVTPAEAGVRTRRRIRRIPAFAGMTLIALSGAAAAQERQPPYWASIASGEAMTRAGPGKTYPGIWLYKRRDLPVRVVKRYEHWRLIQDPDGVQGWMLATLLSDRRTAVVKNGDPRPVTVQPGDNAKVRYLAEPGVVGRIEKCQDGWCHIAIGKREGYIRTVDLWGVGETEVVDD
jgi:SH3-like domain-containing protein